MIEAVFSEGMKIVTGIIITIWTIVCCIVLIMVIRSDQKKRKEL